MTATSATTPPAPFFPTAAPAAGAPAASLPLSRLLGHAADAVQAVRAGRSLDAALAACPADARPGTQALAFHAMRWLGGAQAVRARLAPKPPAPAIDALLLTALALLWPDDPAADGAPGGALGAAASGGSTPGGGSPDGPVSAAVPRPDGRATATVPRPDGPATTALPPADGPATAAVPRPDGPATAALPPPDGPTTAAVPRPDGPATAALPPPDGPTTAALHPPDGPTTAAVPRPDGPATDATSRPPAAMRPADAAAPGVHAAPASAGVSGVAAAAGVSGVAASAGVHGAPTAAGVSAAPAAAAAAVAALPYAAHTLVDQAVTAARQRRGAAAADAPSSTNRHRAAAQAGAAKDAAFVNAVLRRFLRERAGLVDAVRRDDPVARHNHPAWWVERLRLDWPAQWQRLLRANQDHPPMTLRVNARRGDVPGYLRRLADAGIAADPGVASEAAVAPHAVVLVQPCPVSRLPGFADGDVSVQDAAAQRAAPLLLGLPADGAAASSSAWRLPPGARVLDACAAPGGKTAHLLELADLDLLAIDSDAGRLRRVDDTLARLRLRARTLAADAADPAAWWDGRPFDAILLDAPCSASGIVRRHPDVRWLRRAADIARLAQTQARLLDALWPLVAVGGRLLYATCSVFHAEGRQPIDAFLQRRPDARLAADPPSPGHLLPLADNHSAADDRGVGDRPADGFFYALLEKH